MKPGRVSAVTRIVLLGCLVGGALWGLSAPLASTRQAVDFQVSTRTIPLSVKAIDFLHRHAQYRLLAEAITRGLKTDRERLEAVLAWTRQEIRPTPAGWPVVDDHILHVIIRGYGVSDQMADVFATLATYAGVPAFWRLIEFDDGSGRLVLSFARVEGRWTMVDVAHGLLFTDADGRLVPVEELLRAPALVEATAGSLAPYGVPYRQYVERVPPFGVPEVLRAEKQMPLPRLAYEVRRAMGLLPTPRDQGEGVTLVQAGAIR